MGAIDNVKEVVKLVREIDNIELYRRILDLQGEINELIQENFRLSGQVRALSEKMEIQGSLEFRNCGYWRKNDNGDEEGPFCSACWDGNRKLIRLVEGGQHLVGCPVCQTVRSKTNGASTDAFSAAQFKASLGASR